MPAQIGSKVAIYWSKVATFWSKEAIFPQKELKAKSLVTLIQIETNEMRFFADSVNLVPARAHPCARALASKY